MMERDRDEDRVGLDLPVVEVDESTYLRALEENGEYDRLAGADVDPGDDLLPGGETGVSRLDAPGQ